MNEFFEQFLYELVLKTGASISYLMFVLLIAGALFVSLKFEKVKYFFESRSLYKKIGKEQCAEPDKTKLKKLFELTSNQICIGEKVVSHNGMKLKKISSIKSATSRLAAQNKGVLSFAINTEDGTAYKILEIHNSGKKYYFKIEYSELNHFMEMNNSAYDKYKKITEANWQNI